MNDKEIWNSGEDTSTIEYESNYGNYVENDLVPQLAKLNALKLTANRMPIEISNKNSKLSKKVSEKISEIISRVDLNSVAYVLEERLSRVGNGVVMFEKTPTGGFNFFVPTTSITRVDPASGELLYLQIIRYSTGGDFVNITTETHTKSETVYSIYSYENEKDAKNDIEEVTKSNGRKSFKGKKSANIPDELKHIKFDVPQKNELGWIRAVYFENIPTTDKRGEPDIRRSSRYVELLNKTFVRFHWELDFNKSKLIYDEELGANLWSSKYQNLANQNKVSDNFVIRRNSFNFIGGQGSSGTQYFETSNQNLMNLIQLFNYFLKKLWEQSGQHQAGSDIGKQISDFQATQEKSAEHLVFKNKVIRRKHVWRELFWRVLLLITDKEFGGYGKAPKDFKITDINVNIKYAKVDIEKDIIENEIKKIQANLTTREKALSVIEDLTDEDANELASQYLKQNTKDIKEQLQAVPVHVQQPSIANPQGKENKQNSSFYKQAETMKGENK